ncbi:MAG: ATP-binding protein [Clostridia bacterium]|nr:ATP-binding protein [Clostridia bacterium]
MTNIIIVGHLASGKSVLAEILHKDNRYKEGII